MPISAICPRSAEARAPHGSGSERGFTLLEVLITLVIVAAVSALLLPRFAAIEAGLRFALSRADIERQIEALTPRAFADGRPMTIGGAGETILLELPAGWRATTPQPIAIRADGICSGGVLTIDSGSERWDYRLDGPRCMPRLVEAR